MSWLRRRTRAEFVLGGWVLADVLRDIVGGRMDSFVVWFFVTTPLGAIWVGVSVGLIIRRAVGRTVFRRDDV